MAPVIIRNTITIKTIGQLLPGDLIIHHEKTSYQFDWDMYYERPDLRRWNHDIVIALVPDRAKGMAQLTHVSMFNLYLHQPSARRNLIMHKMPLRCSEAASFDVIFLKAQVLRDGKIIHDNSSWDDDGT